MSWNYSRAHERVRKSVNEAPVISVQRFREDYLAEMRVRKAALGIQDNAQPTIRDLRPGQAIIVDTVQIYVNVTNYNDMRLDQGRETPESHARALSFLHLHYAALDRATDGVGAQRVDFHGPRMHAALLLSAGTDVASQQELIEQALRLARRTVAISEAATRDIARGSTSPIFRIGIDIGTCVAVDSGRGDEREPLFIGGAANHAAKLAEGDRGGIFVSDRVRALFGLSQKGGLSLERLSPLDEIELIRMAQFDLNADSVTADAESVRETIRAHRNATIGMNGFDFHHHTPPLRSIDYAELRPSNSIRMPLVSIFADLDGYTRYVDEATAAGNVHDPVRDLHVVRAELNAVLQDDFDGRKVRFIGDCIHGLLAVGNSMSTDAPRSVERATVCAGALRSSFKVVQDFLPSARRLGLAIGYELGATPISRIGIRGDRAVRVASSNATLLSELCQRTCNGHQTRIGERAYAEASDDTRALFEANNIATNLDYDTVLLGSTPAAAAAGEIAEPVADNRSHGAS
jgi:hypothetical protein